MSVVQTLLHGHSTAHRSSPAERSLRLSCDLSALRALLLFQQCLQDIMDGYLPSELQPRYPDGVCLQVSATPSSWHGDFAGWSPEKGRLRFVVLCRCVWGQGRHAGHLQQPLQEGLQHRG